MSERREVGVGGRGGGGSSGVSGEALGLASYADVPVPPAGSRAGPGPWRAAAGGGDGRFMVDMDGMGRRIREAGAEHRAGEAGLGARARE